MTDKKTKKDDGNIYMNRDTYRKFFQWYKGHSKIPFHEKIVITDNKEKKDEREEV